MIQMCTPWWIDRSCVNRAGRLQYPKQLLGLADWMQCTSLRYGGTPTEWPCPHGKWWSAIGFNNVEWDFIWFRGTMGQWGSLFADKPWQSHVALRGWQHISSVQDPCGLIIIFVTWGSTVQHIGEYHNPVWEILLTISIPYQCHQLSSPKVG